MRDRTMGAAGPERLPRETEACANCRHFHRHYTVEGQATPWGHCTWPRLKMRRAVECCGEFLSRWAGDWEITLTLCGEAKAQVRELRRGGKLGAIYPEVLQNLLKAGLRAAMKGGEEDGREKELPAGQGRQ